VTFLDKNLKTLQDWEILKIPVNNGQTTDITQTSWLSVALSSDSNEIIGQGRLDVLVPIRWIDNIRFESNPDIASPYRVKGEVDYNTDTVSIVYNMASVKIWYPDISIIDNTCRHNLELVSIPEVASTWQYPLYTWIHRSRTLENI